MTEKNVGIIMTKERLKLRIEDAKKLGHTVIIFNIAEFDNLCEEPLSNVEILALASKHTKAVETPTRYVLDALSFAKELLESGSSMDQKCLTCNGHGVIAGYAQDGSFDGEDCPECNKPVEKLDEAEMLACLSKITHEVPVRLPPGWRKLIEAAQDAILKKNGLLP